jgi:hypothetical protein
MRLLPLAPDEPDRLHRQSRLSENGTPTAENASKEVPLDRG